MDYGQPKEGGQVPLEQPQEVFAPARPTNSDKAKIYYIWDNTKYIIPNIKHIIFP